MVLNARVGEITPALPVDERETLALFMSASMEGMTMFAGHGKPWIGKMPAIERIAVKSFLYAIRAMRPGEISGAVQPDSEPQLA